MSRNLETCDRCKHLIPLSLIDESCRPAALCLLCADHLEGIRNDARTEGAYRAGTDAA